MTSFTDDFNRTDSTDLGAGWVEVSGDWSIASNQLSPGNLGGTIILRAAGAMAGNNHSAQITMTAVAAVSKGVWCRGNSNITNGYLWRNDGTSWDLFSVVGGSFTNIGTFAGAAAPGDVAKVEAIGTTIKGYVNGVARVTVTDSSVTTGTSVGLRSESSGSVRYDDFAAADTTSVVTGTAAAPLGALTATASARPTVNATAAAALGALSGSASGRPTVNATATAPLGGSAAAAVATRTINATATAPLGAATATAAGRRTVHATASAPLGTLAGQAHAAQLVTGTASAPLGALTAAAIVVSPMLATAVPVSSGWYGLLDIVNEGTELRRAELERDPVACQDCGEPLRTGPNGELYCAFDGTVWAAGNRRVGLVGTTHN